MKRLVLLAVIAILVCNGYTLSQQTDHAAAAVSGEGNYIQKALTNNQFNWLHYKSQYFLFHYLPASWSKSKLDSVFSSMDIAYKKIINFLLVTAKRKRIDIFLVGGKEDVKAICGSAYSAVALLNERGIIFSNHPSTTAPENLPHELMHLISLDKWGMAHNILLNEGLATYACDKSAFNYDFHSITKYLNSKNNLPELKSLLNNFNRYSEITSYYSGASFVKFILDKYGFKQFATLWKNGVEAGSHKLGITLKKLEQEWHAAFAESKSISDSDWEKLITM